jgi:Ca-activated chloride channel family protein
VPLVVTGRYAGEVDGSITVTGRTRDDREFSTTVAVQQRDEPAVTAQWARARLRDLEDTYSAQGGDEALEQRIVATSLRFGVLCRFTAFVAVDSRVVTEGGKTRRVTQPVELPSGWESPEGPAAPMFLAASASAMAPVPPMAAPPGPRFAPARARGFSAGGGPELVSSRKSVPVGPFLGAPGGGVLGSPVSGSSSLDDVRALAATEAQRLDEAEDLPVYERRDRLEDLASRLRVLLSGLTGQKFGLLRDLLAMLDSEASVDHKWAAAFTTLTAFANGGTTQGSGRTPGSDAPGSDAASAGRNDAGSAARRRKPFWKA